MFNKKETKKLEKELLRFKEIEARFKDIEDRLDNIVFCHDCGRAMHKDTSQVVHLQDVCSVGYPIKYVSFYYCSKHKKPYDLIETKEKFDDDSRNFTVEKKYYKTNVEVNKKGKEIKKSNK